MSVLLHIGYVKSGSTYLQEWFASHPAMYYRPKAIAGFYDTESFSFYAEVQKPMHQYYVLSSEDLSVWKSKGSIINILKPPSFDYRHYQAKLAKTLHSVFPQGKVLIVTRGYSTLLSSMYAEYLKGGGILTFDDMQRTFAKYFAAFLDYNHVVELYRKQFGAENVVVLPFEMLRDNPASFLKKIEDELGINERYAFKADKVNAAMEWKVLDAYRRVSSAVYRLTKFLPEKMQGGVFYMYSKALNKKEPIWLMKALASNADADSMLYGKDELLNLLRGKASVLKDEEIYQPYLNDYLL